MRAVNLLPREEPRHRGKRITLGIQLALVSPFVIGSLLAAVFLLTSSTVNNDRATLKELQDQLAAIPPRETTPQPNAQLVLQRDQRIAALGAALQARVAWDRILREISSVLPEDVWLTVLSAVSPESPGATTAPPPAATTEAAPAETTGGETATPAVPAPAPASSGGEPLRMEGHTYSQEGVARFLSRLAVIPELQNVKLVRSHAEPLPTGGVVLVDFAITADIRSQAAS